MKIAKGSETGPVLHGFGYQQGVLSRARRPSFRKSDEGWPDPLLVDSGNGYHLYYQGDRCSANSSAWRYLLGYLSKRFSTETVSVDQCVFDASRISRLPGTFNTKGPHTSDRPHRRSSVVTYPKRWEPLSHNALHALAIAARYTGHPFIPERANKTASVSSVEDKRMLDFLNAFSNYLSFDRLRHKDGVSYSDLHECPFAESQHSNDLGGKTSIILHKDGPGFHCFSDDCTDYRWQHLMTLIEQQHGERPRYYRPVEVDAADFECWGGVDDITHGDMIAPRINLQELPMPQQTSSPIAFVKLEMEYEFTSTNDPLLAQLICEGLLPNQTPTWEPDFHEAWQAVLTPDVMNGSADPEDWCLVFEDVAAPFSAMIRRRVANPAEPDRLALLLHWSSALNTKDVIAIGESLGAARLFLIAFLTSKRIVEARDNLKADYVKAAPERSGGGEEGLRGFEIEAELKLISTAEWQYDNDTHRMEIAFEAGGQNGIDLDPAAWGLSDCGARRSYLNHSEDQLFEMIFANEPALEQRDAFRAEVRDVILRGDQKLIGELIGPAALVRLAREPNRPKPLDQKPMTVQEMEDYTKQPQSPIFTQHEPVIVREEGRVTLVDAEGYVLTHRMVRNSQIAA